MTSEIWKDVKGYEGFYKVSNYGDIMSLPRNGTTKNSRILKQRTGKGIKDMRRRYIKVL